MTSLYIYKEHFWPLGIIRPTQYDTGKEKIFVGCIYDN